MKAFGVQNETLRFWMPPGLSQIRRDRSLVSMLQLFRPKGAALCQPRASGASPWVHDPPTFNPSPKGAALILRRGDHVMTGRARTR